MKSRNAKILIGVLAVIGLGIATYYFTRDPIGGIVIVRCDIARNGCTNRWGLCDCEWFPSARALEVRERVMKVNLKNGNLIFDSDVPFPQDSVDYFEIDPNQILEGTEKLKARQFLLKEGKYQVQKTSKGGSRVEIPVTIIK